MRPIKFRAWDKLQNKMLHVTEIRFNGTCTQGDLFVNRQNKLHIEKVNAVELNENGTNYYCYYENLADESTLTNLELMQFTGICDKNGNEIYEGDIVVKNAYPYFYEKLPNYVGIVKYIYCQYQIVLHCVNELKHGISEGINAEFNDEGYEEGECSDWEIVGNIYENSELIELTR